MRPQRFFSSSRIARASHLRTNEAWIAEQIASESSRFLPLVDGALALRRDEEKPSLVWLEQIEVQTEYVAFLGLDDQGAARFACGLEQGVAENLAKSHGIEFRGLRTVASLLGDEDAGLSAYARGLDLWQRNHRYCGACGGSTRLDQSGFRRVCTQCERQHFPRLDPAIIVAVTFEDQLLLGRQAAWPPRFYSVLAGFVEPGESLEDAVRREVEEESGIQVGDVQYHASQPWPFPSSIMIGFRAEALSTDIRTDDELEEARWLDVDALREEVQAGRLFLSPSLSISRDLIDDFVYERCGEDTHDWAPDAPAWRRD